MSSGVGTAEAGQFETGILHTPSEWQLRPLLPTFSGCQLRSFGETKLVWPWFNAERLSTVQLHACKCGKHSVKRNFNHTCELCNAFQRFVNHWNSNAVFWLHRVPSTVAGGRFYHFCARSCRLVGKPPRYVCHRNAFRWCFFLDFLCWRFSAVLSL